MYLKHFEEALQVEILSTKYMILDLTRIDSYRVSQQACTIEIKMYVAG